MVVTHWNINYTIHEASHFIDLLLHEHVGVEFLWLVLFFFFFFCESLQDLFRLVSDTDHNLNTKAALKKYYVCMCLKRILDLRSWTWARVRVKPICLAFLKMHCTVCHSLRCGLTSPTVKTTGSWPGLPVERRVETLQKWVYSIHPTPPGAPCTRTRLRANQVLQVLHVFRSPTHFTLQKQVYVHLFKLFKCSCSSGLN